jgi:hypothetical protein
MIVGRSFFPVLEAPGCPWAGGRTCHSSCYLIPHFVDGTVTRPRGKKTKKAYMSARTELARRVLQMLQEGSECL